MSNPWWRKWVAGEGSEGHCGPCGHAQNKHVASPKKEVNGVTKIVVRCKEDGCDHIYGIIADKNNGSVRIGGF